MNLSVEEKDLVGRIITSNRRIPLPLSNLINIVIENKSSSSVRSALSLNALQLLQNYEGHGQIGLNLKNAYANESNSDISTNEEQTIHEIGNRTCDTNNEVHDTMGTLKLIPCGQNVLLNMNSDGPPSDNSQDLLKIKPVEDNIEAGKQVEDTGIDNISETINAVYTLSNKSLSQLSKKIIFQKKKSESLANLSLLPNITFRSDNYAEITPNTDVPLDDTNLIPSTLEFDEYQQIVSSTPPSTTIVDDYEQIMVTSKDSGYQLREDSSFNDTTQFIKPILLNEPTAIHTQHEKIRHNSTMSTYIQNPIVPIVTNSSHIQHGMKNNSDLFLNSESEIDVDLNIHSEYDIASNLTSQNTLRNGVGMTENANNNLGTTLQFSSVFAILISSILAVALILFILSLLWILKRNQCHSTVYLSYELSKSRFPISRAQPPSILAEEITLPKIQENITDYAHYPKQPIYLHQELSTSCLYLQPSGDNESCDSGIDNLGFMDCYSSVDNSCQPNEVKVKESQFPNRKFSHESGLKVKEGKFPNRKFSHESGLKVCLSDGNILAAYQSLTKCMVPPPPYSSNFQNWKLFSGAESSLLSLIKGGCPPDSPATNAC